MKIIQLLTRLRKIPASAVKRIKDWRYKRKIKRYEKEIRNLETKIAIMDEMNHTVNGMNETLSQILKEQDTFNKTLKFMILRRRQLRAGKRQSGE